MARIRILPWLSLFDERSEIFSMDENSNIFSKYLPPGCQTTLTKNFNKELQLPNKIFFKSKKNHKNLFQFSRFESVFFRKKNVTTFN